MTTRHRQRLVREARQTVALLEIRKAGLTAALPRLQEVGRVLSAANEEKLRAAAENISSVLAALGDETEEADTDGKVKCATCDGSGKIREGSMECPDCKGEGKVAKEAKRTRLMAIAEAYSAAAMDAASGAWIIGSLLDLMSDESDEPGELAILQGAYALLSQWVSMEVASIGSPEDLADGSDTISMWGWEAAHKKLRGAGGFSAASKLTVSLVESKLIAPVREAAVKEDGTGAIKIIQPGWGSSGYYGAEMLERDGPLVFTAGTKMFWDHPTVTEEWERPERSLRDLAAETTADCVWDANGAEGPGLYAPMKVREEFRGPVNELAPSIGVSIRAYGVASTGEAEGQTGPIIEELVGAESIDFVTFPGAGGAVLQLFESARRPAEIPAPKEAIMTVETDPKFVAEKLRADRAEEQVMLREAKDVIAAQLATAQIPDITKKRLAESLAGNPPAKDGKLDAAALKALEDAFKKIGMSEAGAKVAAAGRSK